MQSMIEIVDQEHSGEDYIYYMTYICKHHRYTVMLLLTNTIQFMILIDFD